MHSWHKTATRTIEAWFYKGVVKQSWNTAQK